MTPHTGRDTGALRILVVGPGVSDGRRRSWAYLTRPLGELGHHVYVADSDAARSPEVLAATFDWQVRTNRPHLVVHVPDGHAAHDEGVDRLTASGEATTLVVHHPFDLDPIGGGTPARPTSAQHHLEVVVGGDEHALLTDPGTFVTPADAPTHDVVLFGPRLDATESAAAALADAGIDLRLLDPSWDRHPLLRGLAYGRPPLRFLARRLARSRVVVVAPSASPAETELRVLEAAQAGRPLLVLERDGAVHDLLGHAWGDDLVAAVHAVVDGPAAPAATAGWSEAWPDLVERALAVHRATPGERQFWSFNVGHPPVPKVAVITSVYRGADYLVDAVDSLREQTMDDIEIMLLDDGSDDDTTDLIRDLAHEDPRVRGYRQTNIGQAGRFDLLAHQTIVESRAPFIAHLGADDIAHPQRFERQLALFDDDEALDIASSIGVWIDGAGRRKGVIFNQPEPVNGWSMLRTQQVMNVVAHPTVLMRRRVFDLVGPYSRGFAADYDCWTKGASWLRFRRLDLPLIAYRIHERGSSTVGDAAKRAASEFEWIRDAIRSEITLLDLYPELDRLGPTPERIGRAAAHFASLLVASPYDGSAEHAMRESDLARRWVQDRLVEFNALLAAVKAGRPPKDLHARLRAMAKDGVREAQVVLDRLGGMQLEVRPIDTLRIFPEVDKLVPGPEDDVWYLHGQVRTTKVAWCEVDWSDAASLRALLTGWCARFPVGSPARLVLSQRDIAAEDALVVLHKSIAEAGVVLEDAADIELSVDLDLARRAEVHIDLTVPSGVAGLPRSLQRLQRRLLWA